MNSKNFLFQFNKQIAIVLALILTFSLSLAAQAAPGDLDTSFGSGGTSANYIQATNGNLSPGKGVAQSDGKVVAFWDAHLNTGNSFTNVISRYNADGTLDSTFGSGGFVYLNWNGAGNSFGNVYDIAIQAVGAEERIILAGSARNASGNTILRVERYNTDGSIDVSFGSNGTALINAGYALTVTVQPDGKILTMGDSNALVRLNVNGTLDASFGSGGVVQTSALRARSLAVQSTGRIIAAGYSTVRRKNVMTVVRFNTNGSLDDGGRNDSTPGDSFGTAGKTTLDFFGAGSSCYEVKIDSNGKIVAAGSASGENTSDFGVARLTANGQLDSTFDGDGKATVDFSGSLDTAKSVELQSDGKIVLTGISNGNLGIARLNPNGTPDVTFGQGGKVVNDFSSAPEKGFDGVIQIDPVCGCEKIVALGTAEIGGLDYAIAARYIL